MANEVEIRVTSKDQSGPGFASAKGHAAKASLEMQAAGIRVEKAQNAAAASVKRFGVGSLQARESAVNLARAEHDLEAATHKTTRAADEGAKVSLRASTGFGRVRASIGEMVPVAAAGAAGMAAFGLKSVMAASDLNETLSKSSVIFKTNAGQVEKWASTAAKSFGLSKQEAIANASSLGDMFSQMGIGSSRTLQMSEGIVKLAGDLASFHNADPTEVIEAQTAAFRGEYDSVQRFVPTINAAAVETEALARTHKKSTAELTAAEKAQAVYALMLKGTTAAQGDFARTASGAANSSRILAAETKDAAAHFGQMLLPAYQGAIAAGRQVVGVTDRLVTGFQGLSPATKAASAGLAGMVLLAKNWASIASAAETGALKLMYAADKIRPAGIAAGAGLGVVSVAVGVLISKMEEGKRRAADFIDTLLNQSGAEAAADKLKVLIHAMGDETSASKLSNEERFQAIAKVKELSRQVTDEGRASAVNATQTDLMTVAVKDAAGAMEKEKTAAQQLAEEMDESLNPRLDVVKANLALKDSLGQLSQAHKDNGSSLSENTREGRANQKALVDAIEAAKGAAEAEAGLGGSLAHNEGVLNTNIAKVRAAAIAAGLNKKQVDALIASIYKMPRTRDAQIRLDIAAAEAKAKRIRAAMGAVKSRDVSIIVSQNGTVQKVQREINSITGKAVAIDVGTVRGAGPHGRASGGIVGADTGGARGGLTWVGEAGRELVRLPYGSTVYPHGQSEGMAAAGGGGRPQVVLQVSPGGSALDLLFIDWLRKAVRDRGGADVVFA